ncbi:MAG: hypothetical protein Q7T49_01275 [bacterium]|nr:hypothetical protein [bacterium]
MKNFIKFLLAILIFLNLGTSVALAIEIGPFTTDISSEQLNIEYERISRYLDTFSSLFSSGGANLEAQTQYNTAIRETREKIKVLQDKLTDNNLTPEERADIEQKIKGWEDRINEWEQLKESNFGDTFNDSQQATADMRASGSAFTRSMSTIFALGKEVYSRGTTPSGIYASVGAITVSMANYLFNTSINLSVVKFSELYKGSASAINDAWKIGRDLANFFFIFILLYIAISTILDRVDWKKLLVRVIIIALLVNFSAVIPKVMIDASNILALTFYDNIGNQVSNEPRDLTAPFLNSILPQADKSWGQWLTDKITFGFLNFDNWIDGTMMFILTYILLVASILFIIRVGVLIMLIILSPLAFIGWIIPSASAYSNQWWQKLMSESIFAPAFMFLLYATITIVSNNSLANSINEGIDSYIGQIIYFLIVVTFLTATLTIAKKFSSTGAGIAIGWADKVKKLAFGGVALGAGTAGAYTLGKGARAALKSETFQKFAARNPFVGNLAQAGLSGVAKKKFGGATSYEDRVERTASRIEDFKTSESRSQYLSNLGEIDRKAAYGKLSDRQKAELHEHITTSTAITPQQKIELGKLAPKVGTENYEKMEAERKKVKDANAIKSSKEILKDPATLATKTPTEVRGAINKLNGKRINSIDKDVLTDHGVSSTLDARQLKSLMDDDSPLEIGDYDKIRNWIESDYKFITHNLTRPIDRNPATNPDANYHIRLEESYKWLNNPTGIGNSFRN